MSDEYNALISQHIWNLVQLPSHKSVIGCKWIFKVSIMLMEVLPGTNQVWLLRVFTKLKARLL